MRRIGGTAIARKLLRDPPYAGARKMIAGQLGEILARIHAVDIETCRRSLIARRQITSSKAYAASSTRWASRSRCSSWRSPGSTGASPRARLRRCWYMATIAPAIISPTKQASPPSSIGKAHILAIGSRIWAGCASRAGASALSTARGTLRQPRGIVGCLRTSRRRQSRSRRGHIGGKCSAPYAGHHLPYPGLEAPVWCAEIHGARLDRPPRRGDGGRSAAELLKSAGLEMAQDRPTASELLAAVADFLREDSIPTLDRAEPPPRLPDAGGGEFARHPRAREPAGTSRRCPRARAAGEAPGPRRHGR